MRTTEYLRPRICWGCAVILCALSFGTQACGGTSNSGGTPNQPGAGPSAPVSPAQVADVQSFVSALCAEFATCCKAEGLPSDGLVCRALYGAFIPAASYNSQAGAACLSEVRAAQDKCTGNPMGTPSCSRISSGGGIRKPGETCEQDSDCAPADAGEVECAFSFANNAQTRQCQIQLPGTVGSKPCVGTRDGNTTFSFGAGDTIPTTGYICDVANGLTCNSTTLECQPLAAVGERCTSSTYACVKTAYCDFQMNSCRLFKAIGATCSDHSECGPESYCASGTKTCTARRANGQACTVNSECLSEDCTNGLCAPNADLGLSLLCGAP